jgi:uncharacterized protein
MNHPMAVRALELGGMLNRTDMDRLFERHAAAEAAKDVGAILATLADSVEHDPVGDPSGVLKDRDAIAQRYRQLFETFGGDEDLKNLRRYYGEDFFVDESVWSGRAIGTFLGIPGENRPLTFRILHVCEVRDGRISRENTWLDVASILRQLAPAED